MRLPLSLGQLHSAFIPLTRISPPPLPPRITKKIITTTNPHFNIQNYHLTKCPTTRLFGSKAPLTPHDPSTYTPGTIDITIDLPSKTNPTFPHSTKFLHTTLTHLSQLIKYPTYDINLHIIDLETMRLINLETRQVDAPTDILSFQMHPAIEAGLLEDPEFDIPDYYLLGEMFLCWEYVVDVTKRDAEDEEEYEEERGASGIMADMMDPGDRVVPLLIHGMLHLVGYDHEEDEDYEVMVEKEEEIWRELKERMRLGDGVIS